MKAIMLAAGNGERLKAVINGLPKPMVRIKGRPILEHNVHLLKKYGITDIFINLHHLPRVIADYFGDGSFFGVNIEYSHEETLLGTAGAVRRICGDCRDNDPKGPFLVVYGDNLFSFEIDEVIGFHALKNGTATIAVYEKKGDLSHSGVVSIDDDSRITCFIEKPKTDLQSGGLVNTGLYVLEPEVLDFIPEHGPSDFGKDVFPEMLRRGKSIYAFKSGSAVKGQDENLIAIDTPELLRDAMMLR